jgi:hypothetical protein
MVFPESFNGCVNENAFHPSLKRSFFSEAADIPKHLNEALLQQILRFLIVTAVSHTDRKHFWGE